MERTTPMEIFAHDAKTRDAIANARGECAHYFWRSVAAMFGGGR